MSGRWFGNGFVILLNNGRLVLKKILLGMLLICTALSFAGRINITNDTGNYSFFYVHISPSSADSWGDDFLGSSETISAGESRRFRVDNDTYDIKIIDEDDDEYIFWNVDVSGTLDLYVSLDDIGEQDWGSPSSYPVSDGSAPITIENDLGNWTIWYVYGDPSDSPWGEDRLGSDLLSPGEELTFYVPANDYYDFKVEDEDGDVYILWEVWVDEDGFYWSVDLDDMD